MRQPEPEPEPMEDPELIYDLSEETYEVSSHIPFT